MNNLIKMFLVFSLTTLIGCSQLKNINFPGGGMVAEKDSKVKVLYKGTLQDGTVFDESPEDKPLEFIVGSGQLIKGFDDAVLGMRVGDKKTIHIKPEEAYGEKNDMLVQDFPRSFFPADYTPMAGQMITLQDQTGRPVPAEIAEVGVDMVKIDLNHPLAGKELTFEISVVSIDKETKTN